MKVKTGGAITILNAIVPLLGSALGVGLWVEADAEESDEPEVIPETPLSREALIEALKMAGRRGARVVVNSSIPSGWGLKSSSAVANAIILSVLELYSSDYRLIDVVKAAVRASRRAKVTITGAMDDAAASALGGLVLTDNSRDELLLRIPVRELTVLILLPEGQGPRPTLSFELKTHPELREAMRSLSRLIYKNPWAVMTLNGLIYSRLLGYDDTPILEALKAGALAASISGTGPSIAAICEVCDDLRDVWSSRGKVMKVLVNNRAAYTEKSSHLTRRRFSPTNSGSNLK